MQNEDKRTYELMANDFYALYKSISNKDTEAQIKAKIMDWLIEKTKDVHEDGRLLDYNITVCGFDSETQKVLDEIDKAIKDLEDPVN